MSEQHDTVRCHSCGQPNWPTVSACHYCGSALRREAAAEPAQGSPGQTPQFAHVQPLAYVCPACGVSAPPHVVKRFSGLGWAVLLVGFFLCVVGALLSLFFIEEHTVCPACGYRSR